MSLPVRAFLLALLTFVVANPASAYLRYEAPMAEARWTVETGPLACHLTHPVPRFGVAVFSRSSTGEQTFRMFLYRPPQNPQEARLASMPSQWKYGAPRDMGASEIHPEQEALVLGHRLTNALLQRLEAGDRVAIMYEDWYQPVDAGSAAMTPVGFRPAYREYLQCITGLQERRFEHRSRGSGTAEHSMDGDIATDDSALSRPLAHALRSHGLAAPEKPVESPRVAYFVFDNSELTFGERERLRVFAEEILTDPSDPMVIITGHTDNQGEEAYNNTLGEQRAHSVRAYLEKLGIPARRSVHDSRGEFQPVADNRDDDGRAQIRRASLETRRQ
ncbi:MAG: OmpA family protein [Ectothiorhodospiraceae bacterium]|nr:OmpA family protein [Ectothiorhodospiraceae bacterium]